MAAKVTIKGGSDLKARLASIPAGAPEMARLWAEDAASRMRQTAPNARRPASGQFSTKSGTGGRFGNTRAAVYGAFWWIFVDRGTKAHFINAKKSPVLSNRPRGATSGGTVFGKRVFHKRQSRRPFITKAAQDALASSDLANFIVKQWNRRRIGGAHTKFL